jgi:hypothetical protein
MKTKSNHPLLLAGIIGGAAAVYALYIRPQVVQR